MSRGQRLFAKGVLAAIAAVVAVPASATVINSSNTIASCSGSSGTFTNCTDTTLYSNSPANDTTSFIGGTIDGQNPMTADFVTAFNDWNTANGDAWTLVNGGTLDLGLSLAIGTGIGTNGAGVSPVIVNITNFVQGSGPSLSQLVWTQALFTDYTPTAGLTSSPTVSLDTYSLSAGSSSSAGAFTTACTPIPGAPSVSNNTTPSTIGATPQGTAYCDPIYPFQYASSDNGDVIDGVTLGTDFFYDAPAGPWPTGAFRGVALLSTVTYDTNSAGVVTGQVLTVYQGVDYGFSLSATPVPEPGTAGIIGVGVLGALFARTRPVRRAA